MNRQGLWRMLLVGVLLALTYPLTGCSVFGSRNSTFAGDGGVALAEGRSDLLAGDLEGARQNLTSAAESGRSAEAHYYLALIELNKGDDGDPDYAQQQIQESIKAYPCARQFVVKGALLEEDPDAALRAYRRGLEMTSDGTEAARLLRRNMGVLLARQGRWEEAYEHFSTYVAQAETAGQSLTDPEYGVWGLMLYRRGEDVRAESAWDRIRDPELAARIRRARGSRLAGL
jgi:tetratricopeptide (TPR) repeat protein